MANATRLCVPLATLALLVPAGALASRAAPAGTGTSPLLRSRQLWATINVCNPLDQPDTLGIRGSMPGDGHSRDRMFMSFRLQYLNTSTNHWTDLAGTAAPAFISVGGGKLARQGGQSFQLVPVTGRPAFALRGLVEFQWRRGKTVLISARRATSVGHTSLAGADPANFSAATCLIG